MHFPATESVPDDAYVPQVGGGFAAGHLNHHLDDVFASAPASPTDHDAQNGPQPADMRRLETEHTTAGYREGITVAKEASIQAGFDEGFSLGATVGARAGYLLGVMEGIAEALGDQPGETQHLANKLLHQARQELSTSSIFSADYWMSDGNWKYPVTAQDGTQILFADVADAHPLIKKWRLTVDEQVGAWKIEMSLLDDETGPRLDAAAAASQPLHGSSPTSAKPSLDW